MADKGGSNDQEVDRDKFDDESDDRNNKELGTGHRANSTSFKKGHSGNPSGRPKGSRNRKAVVAEAANAKVTINEKGKRVKRTKFELSQIQLANKAASGDLKAIAMQNDLNFKLGLLGGDNSAAPPQLGVHDDLVMADIVRRIRESKPLDDPVETPSEQTRPSAKPESQQEQDP